LTLTDAAVDILKTADPLEKTRLTRLTRSAWRGGDIVAIGQCRPPPRPARPEQPQILPPNRMPRRGTGGTKGRIALLHALAHIELNAIDLAWDIIARFAGDNLPKAFFDDWVGVAHEESEHFLALEALLKALGSAYGNESAHDGLWDAAEKTSGLLRERLAVIPMALEARALDTAPATIRRLRAIDDAAGVAVLERILEDEIAHVATGVRWFEYFCQQGALDPIATYQEVIRRHFTNGLKAPFNLEARRQAGFSPDYYLSLAS